MSREISAPLTDLLYALAEESADDETIDREAAVWAALLRDGMDVARRVLEVLEPNDAVAQVAIDAEDWAALRGAFGLIVKRDNYQHTVTARAFADEEECLAEWEATKAELESPIPAVEATEMGDTTEGPSSGPMPPRDDD